MSKLTIQDLPKDTDSLREVQAYILKAIKSRGFENDPIPYKMMLLTEEIGELAKALRDHVGGQFDKDTSHREVGEEIADVFICLTALANLMDIDIYEALVAKEEKNLDRVWKSKGEING